MRIRSHPLLDLLSLFTHHSSHLGTGTQVSGGMSSRSREGRTGTTCGSELVGLPQNWFGSVLTTTPARQFTMMTQSTAVSGPPRRKDQDMGGFPGPIELLQRLVHRGTLGSIERAWNKVAAYGRNHGQRRYLSWLPGSIDGLIVGRNSEFYTDQLTDEQLEHLGGIEYRALRFLSYFIFAVSAGIGCHWLSLIVYKSQVLRGVQPHTLRNHYPLAANEVHVRWRLCKPAQACSQGVVHRLVSADPKIPTQPPH